MVAIKIQSLEDIIRAYLKNLGFEGRALEGGVSKLTEKYGEVLKKDDVSSALDKLIGKAAAKIYKEKSWNTEQKTAMLKFCFVRYQGAERWGLNALLEDEISVEAIDDLRGLKLLTAPECRMVQMKAQKIETPQPQKFFGRLLFGKGKQND